MRSQRWRLRAAVTGAVVVALVTATGPTGSAAPPDSPAGSPTLDPSPGAPVSGTPATLGGTPTSGTPLPGSRKITLVTGDVVSYLAGTNGGAPQVQILSDRGVSFTQYRDGDAFYVYPSDAAPLVAAGRLDRDLFDVAYLADNGYADDDATTLPVLVQYPKAARSAGSTSSTTGTTTGAAARVLSSKADALPATTAVRALPVVSAASVRITKSDAAKFWASVDTPDRATGPAASTLDSGVAKISLDHRTKAVLDVSVPQVGAPQAWAAGYDGAGVKVAVLDTGIDDTHPDLAGKVIASKSFVDGQSVKDGHGHGTHVASTIVGSGAASGGKYKGVAPGAQLIVGKVLNNSGNGNDSQIIAGMQWAVEQGAKIVSVSIGGTITDGTDPMSQTVNELSAQYGTLFVIAAGNNGGTRMINAPGAADAALTVAAVDKQDQMADFSSRGPRRGDYALKPDIAAPGVDITAARADGTTVGPIVDEKYTSISGTSMATPHVSGAAAILAQEHPDWTGQKLKQVLVSSSKDDGFSAYEQGAGRLDVARAITQQVRATGNVDFGLLSYPHTALVSRPLTYTNDGDTAVTLDLTATLTSTAGPAPAGTLTISPTTLTVPAHGTADTTVTFDAAKGAETSYGGVVHATGSGGDGTVTVNTAVGGYKQPKQVAVTLKVIPPAGASHVRYGAYWLLRLDDQPGEGFLALAAPAPSVSGSLDAGYYWFSTDVAWYDADGEINRALLSFPSVDATHDVTVTFDLRKAERVVAHTPRPSTPHALTTGFDIFTDNDRNVNNAITLPYGATHLWALPAGPLGPATHGRFVSYTRFLNAVDPVLMSLRDRNRTLALHPQYQLATAEIPKLAGRMSLPVVFAGHGKEADFAGVDATGKLVLLDLSDICPAEPDGIWCTEPGTDRVDNAQRAGAVGVLGYGATGRQFVNTKAFDNRNLRWPRYAIPTMGLTANEGQLLAAKLTRGPVTIDVDATPSTPYVYPLTFVGNGRAVAGTHTVTARNLRQVDNRLHSDNPNTASMSFLAILPGPRNVTGAAPKVDVAVPGTVTTYYGPVGNTVAWSTQTIVRDDHSALVWNQNATDLFDRAGRQTRNWGEQPLVPNTVRYDPKTQPYVWQYCYSCRNGTMLSTQHILTNDGRLNGVIAWGDMNGTPVSEQHLYRTKDGTEIPVTQGLWAWFVSFFQSPYFTLPDGPDEYRMVERYRAPSASARYAGSVDTERTFTSQTPTGGITEVPPPGVGVRCSGWFIHPRNEDGQLTDPQFEPCQPTSELFLSYNFNLDLDNTLPAGRRHTATVSGLYNTFLADPPTLRSLTLSLSFDDGRTWKKAPTKRNRDGSYTVTLDHPALSKTTGAVTVRAVATDTAGNTVKQTITRAYGLTDTAHHGHGHGHGKTGATAI